MCSQCTSPATTTFSCSLWLTLALVECSLSLKHAALAGSAVSQTVNIMAAMAQKKRM